MKKLWIILWAIFLFVGCSQPIRNTSFENQKNVLHGVQLSEDFNVYLNQIAELQKKFPLENQTTLTFPIQIHLVNPLVGSTLHNENFTSAIDYLNATFLASNIQFELVNSGNDYIYSERNIDNFYKNSNVERFLTEKTYDKSVINLYIFDDYQDVIGFTHYPNLNINRIFISKKHLLDPAFVHEVGHFFGLLHTFEIDISTSATADNEACDESGDKICDTPPDPFGASFIEAECTLYGEYKDSNGKLFTPNLGNFMSYYGGCRNHFSEQQSQRMYYIAKKIKYPQMRIRV